VIDPAHQRVFQKVFDASSGAVVFMDTCAAARPAIYAPLCVTFAHACEAVEVDVNLVATALAFACLLSDKGGPPLATDGAFGHSLVANTHTLLELKTPVVAHSSDHRVAQTMASDEGLMSTATSLALLAYDVLRAGLGLAIVPIAHQLIHDEVARSLLWTLGFNNPRLLFTATSLTNEADHALTTTAAVATEAHYRDDAEMFTTASDAGPLTLGAPHAELFHLLLQKTATIY